MTALAKNILWLILAGIVFWLWWGKEFPTAREYIPSDPIRLSLQEASLYQYDNLGRPKSRLRSTLIERLKNGETHYTSLELWQKTPTGERILTAGMGKQQGEILLLENQVLAQELEQQIPTMTLTTNHLIYDRQQKIAYADYGVSLQTPDSFSTADVLQWQIDEKLFILKKNIRSVYVPTS